MQMQMIKLKHTFSRYGNSYFSEGFSYLITYLTYMISVS